MNKITLEFKEKNLKTKKNIGYSCIFIEYFVMFFWQETYKNAHKGQFFQKEGEEKIKKKEETFKEHSIR